MAGACACAEEDEEAWGSWAGAAADPADLPGTG